MRSAVDEGNAVQTTVSSGNRRALPWRAASGPRPGHSGHLLGLSPLAFVLTQSAILVVLALVAVTFLTAVNRGQVYPGVEVAGIPVGGLPAAAAEERLAAATASATGATATLTLGDRTWTPTLAELGIDYDVAGMVRSAMAFGRDHHTGAGLLHAAGLGGDPFGVPLVVRFDQTRFDAYLDRIEAEVGGLPVDATIAIDRVSAVVTPGAEGRALDRAVARETLLAEAVRFEPIVLDLPVVVSPPAVATADAEALAARLDASLSAPIALTLGPETWTIAPEVLAALVVIEPATTGGRTTLVARLDESGLRQTVADLAKRIDGEEAVAASIEDLGSHLKLRPGSQERTVHQDDLVAAVQAAFATAEHQVEIPVEIGAAPAVTVEDLMAEYGITTLLASGDSDFDGSDPNRSQNIAVAVDRIDGTLIPPYETFSYNDALGWIVDVPGFVDAGAMTDGIFQISIGGGVCQVSTTVYRAALRAGLPMVEWWPHVYRTRYYEQGGWPAGYDASIAQDPETPSYSSDFRFRNPTDGWLLLRARIEGTVIRVDLYGPETGFTVEFDEVRGDEVAATEPIEVVDPSLAPGSVVAAEDPLPGVTVTVSRRVYDGNGDLWWEDSFTTVYAPQGGVFRVSPDMEGTTRGT